MAGEISRRTFFGAGLLAVAYGAGVSGAALASRSDILDVDALTTATYKLLGQRPANPFFATTVFGHMVERYPVSVLNEFSGLVLQTAEADLATALEARKLAVMARDIANLWYSGTFFAGTREAQVVGYVDNLSWQAIKFSTPQSVCGGHFGHWYKLPTGQ